MEPKLKVFLSSAQINDELATEREGLPAVFMKQPLIAGFVLWRIEDYASPEDIESHYSIHVKDSDLLILILGKTYRKAVENEFRMAVDKRIPVFAFERQIGERDSEMQNFIKEVQHRATYTSYSSFVELVEKIENSLFQFYLRDTRKPDVVRWRSEHSKHRLSSPDERSLRLLAGILASDRVETTIANVVEAVIIEAALSIESVTTADTIIGKAMMMVRSDAQSTKTEFIKGLGILLESGVIRRFDSGEIDLEPSARERILGERTNLEDSEDLLFKELYEEHRHGLPSIYFPSYKRVMVDAIAQVVYETAVDMVEQEFGPGSNPFPYDADELNRLVAKALASVPALPIGGIAKWQPPLVSILQSNDPIVVTWLNRLRKAYWTLSVLGMDPAAIEYTSDHFRSYCVYMDSHIVLRAMVEAGGESTMCRQIIQIGKKMGIEMRISQSLFHEVEQAFRGANNMLHAAGGDVTRALQFFDAVNRKSDVIDGYMAAKGHNSGLSWENFLNRFYSPVDRQKLEKFLENELGVTVQQDSTFTTAQLGRIEDIAQRLLETRRQTVRPAKNLSDEQRAAWERQYILRTNEARQMAMIYELRGNNAPQMKQYWFITFDEFVYEVSVSLVTGNDSFYRFPCYIKPATWLEIIVRASPEPLHINTFREVLLSRDVQRVADQLEAEVISQMLRARVDQGVENIETLRYMFADIVNRPAVQEAYQEILAAEGILKLAAADKLKDKIITGMKEKLSSIELELVEKIDEVSMERRKAEKAEGRTKYFKRYVGRLISGKRKKKR